MLQSPNPLHVLTAIARQHGVSLAALRGPARTKHLVHVRRLAAVALRGLGLSYPEIGILLRRHHTTIMHHVRQARRGQISPESVK